MAIKIIAGYNDSEWDQYENVFYENFNPDDWDYIIEGDNESEVVMIAEKLYVCDFKTKKIGDKWIAVTYHA
jgi:hypothetical protein